MTDSPHQPSDLDTVITTQLRFLRERKGVPRELVALRARHWGLDWTAATVALIEDGRRRLSIGELLLLPNVLSETSILPPSASLGDLLPDDSRKIAVAPRLFCSPYEIKLLIERRGNILEDGPGGPLSNMLTPPGSEVLSSCDEVTARMAKALRVTIQDLANAAQRIWKRPVRQERDARFEVGLQRIMEAEPLQRTEKAVPLHRRRQALLGHIARNMMKEIREELSRDQPTSRRPVGRAKRKGGAP